MSDDNSYPILPNIIEFWTRLGEFITTYAHAEAALRTHLLIISDVQFHTFNAMIGGLTVDQTIQTIKKVITVREIPPDHDLDETLSHLQKINRARNHILHNAPNFTEDKSGSGITSDAIRAMPGKETTLDVSPKILRQMTADIKRIQSHLISSALRRVDSPIPEALFAAFETKVGSPWEFKGNVAPRKSVSE